MRFYERKSVALLTNEIGVSYGTLSLLGLTNARVLEKPTTAHFMVGEKCVFSCKFCSQAKDSTSSPSYLSRITWPKRDWDQISGLFAGALESGTVKRACVQVVESHESTKAALELVSSIRRVSSELPISVCMSPISVSRVELFLDKEVSQVGLPMDVGSEHLYPVIKGRNHEHSLEVVKECSQRWPGRVTTHFIAGLGETEEEMVKSIHECVSAGTTVGLFAFTPVRGTGMQDALPPGRGSYRRIQLAAYAIRNGLDITKVSFDQGRISRIEMSDDRLFSDIRKGVPFQTSGCPFCNRPYYNERPGQIPMNYPRPLSSREAEECLVESELDLGDVWSAYHGG